MNRIARYLQHYPRGHVARAVAARSARFIRAAAERHLRGRLLDVGCGSKWKADLVGDLVDAYVGLDHPGSMHDRSVVDVFGRADAMPLADATFDAVLCTSVLEHLEDPAAALREARRVLRPGGVGIYTTPMLWHVHEAPRDFYRFTPYGLRHLFEAAGWDVVSCEPMAGWAFTAIAECGYHAMAVAPRVLRPLARTFVAAGNAVAPVADAIDRRINPRWAQWSWMHIVVARRPAEATR